MSAPSQQPASFEEAKARLEQIADAVGNEDMPLDEALDLFEEAVALGLAVSDLVEEGIVVEEAVPAEKAVPAGESAGQADAEAAADDAAGENGAEDSASE